MGTKVMEPEAGQADPQPPKGKRRRLAEPRVRFALIGAAAVIILAAAGAWYYFHGRVSTDDAEINGNITPISSKIFGTVNQVMITDYEHVNAGQVLLKIDPRDYQARVAQAEAALTLAQAQAQAARVNVPLTRGTTQSAIAAAQAEIRAAQAQASRARLAYQTAATAGLSYARAQVSKRQAENTKAQADLNRMKPLVAKAEISELQYDSFVAAAQSAESDLKAAQEQLAEARQQVQIEAAAMAAAQANVSLAKAHLTEASANTGQVPMRMADARSFHASVAQAEANLEEAKLQLGYTTIVAPTEGIVTGKNVDVGQIVQPGQALFAIIPLSGVWIRANFKETQLAKVRPGQRAEVHVDMYNETFPGRVESISGATGSRMSLLPPENATGNFVKVVQRIPIKIVLNPIPPGKAILRPGMNVEATIFTR
ncbi:MAG TPA: HlyD family secretion protein [Candidatus Dormibacteraeota bacterium]|nr:HlyD family secretion protein [Candidatus Dormibacteraeota bacterium]